jgi:hypothetical protein
MLMRIVHHRINCGKHGWLLETATNGHTAFSLLFTVLLDLYWLNIQKNIKYTIYFFNVCKKCSMPFWIYRGVSITISNRQTGKYAVYIIIIILVSESLVAKYTYQMRRRWYCGLKSTIQHIKCICDLLPFDAP